MISLEDHIVLCGLTEEEVLAITEHEHEHEHVPEIVATSIARKLMAKKLGPLHVPDMIRDDIREAVARNDLEHARELLIVMRHLPKDHPEVRLAS